MEHWRFVRRHVALVGGVVGPEDLRKEQRWDGGLGDGRGWAGHGDGKGLDEEEEDHGDLNA